MPSKGQPHSITALAGKPYQLGRRPTDKRRFDTPVCGEGSDYQKTKIRRVKKTMIKMHEFHRSETVVSLNLTTYGENLPEKVPNSRGKDPLFSIGVVAMILNIPYVTRSRLIRLLQREGVLTQNTFPYPRYIDAGWFELRALWTDAGQVPRRTYTPTSR